MPAVAEVEEEVATEAARAAVEAEETAAADEVFLSRLEEQSAVPR